MVRVVIMGASSGIGLKVAEAFASRGVKVGLAARKIAPMEDLKLKYPDMVEYSAIDINKEDAPRQLEALVEKLGGMDVYFHVSGIGYDNPSFNPEREAEVISTNLGGFARMLSSAYRYFRDNNKNGRIVAVTSVAGTKGIGRLAAYSASKRGAQTYMTALEQLANGENADVKFIDIRPGWIRTPLLHSSKNYPLEMTLDYAVPLIIKAIVKAPRVAVIDWRWNVLVGAWRLIPNALWINIPLRLSAPD